MSANHSTSATAALVMALLVFAGMVICRGALAEHRSTTILGGFLGANVFVFLLTVGWSFVNAISNFEMDTLGDTFQAKLFPEVIGSLLVALIASGVVHRVCVTTCFLFSLMFLYAMSHIASARYQPHVPVATTSEKKKRK